MTENDTPEQTPEETDAQVAKVAEARTEKDRTTTEEPPSATDAGVPYVQDAAPDVLDTDPTSSVVVPNDSDLELTPPATMQEQKAPKIEGEAEKRGYYGETAADRAKAEKATLDESLKVQTNAEAVATVDNQTEEN